MRKLSLLLLLTTFAAFPLKADRRQSYFSYDDGGTVVRQADDGMDVEGRINMPVFAGDEISTGRRGRTELRLSDGNVLALDRSTSLVLRSILDSYDGADAAETVVELQAGQVMMHRLNEGSDTVRIDTANASYAAEAGTVFSVETDGKGKDRVSVFEGRVEVRTPERTTRLKSGDEANIDGDGLYGLVDLPRTGASDFERWFLRRTDRYDGGTTSRHLDASIAYSDYDLESNGRWIFVGGLGGWAWRPYVSATWRPYYAGYWHHSPSGSLVWVSNEAWGWVPYHYGRWGFDNSYGWVWLPGGGYAPAWVYWMYGSNYVGWAPAGWWDCYRPYYDWAYRPYARAGLDFGIGFYGRVRVHDLDLKPWTFVNPDVLISTRADQAALTTDVIRERLHRGDGSATISNAGARFTRTELKDPGAAVGVIARRGSIGSGGRDAPGSSIDVTPFVRRDADLSSAVRDRVARPRPAEPSGSGARSAGSSGSPAAPDSRNRDGFRRGDPSPVSGGLTGETRVSRGSVGGGTAGTPRDGGSIRRGDPPADSSRPRDGGTVTERNGSWRDRIARPTSPGVGPARESTPDPAVGERPSPIDRSTQTPPSEWRSHPINRSRGGSTPAPSSSNEGEKGTDVSRRVIDRIGGARVVPRDEPAPSRERSSSQDRASHSSRDGGGHARASAPSPAPPPKPATTESAPPPQKHEQVERKRD